MIYEYAKPTFLSKQVIDSMAQNLARHLGYKNLGSVLAVLGGEIKYKDFWTTKDSKSFTAANNKFVVYVAASDAPNRDRYTIGNGIGHYVLHYLWHKDNTLDFDKVGVYCDRYDDSRVEWEANWFAAGFLMPQDDFKDCFKNYSGDLCKLSQVFNLPMKIVQARAVGLKLIKG